jgi:hypothetical protein
VLELVILQAIAVASRHALIRELTGSERGDRFDLEHHIDRAFDDLEAEQVAITVDDDPGKDVDE